MTVYEFIFYKDGENSESRLYVEAPTLHSAMEKAVKGGYIPSNDEMRVVFHTNARVTD